MGEGFGSYHLMDEEAVMPYISAVNIACGYHAGDPDTMAATIDLAVTYGTEIGAHPGYPDMQGFGRRAMDIDSATLENMIVYQIGALRAIAMARGGVLRHVKAHGALYNYTAHHEGGAKCILQAVASISPELTLYVPMNSLLSQIAQDLAVPIKVEAFIDRRYNGDLSLVSRKQQGSVITDPAAAMTQLKGMITEHRVRSIDGKDIAANADTFCIHGDNPKALDILRYIQAHLAC